MSRDFYLDLSASGLRMPIAADLILHEMKDAETIKCDGKRLVRVVEETARRYQTPLAIPLMDLMLEKTTLLRMFDIRASDIPTFHFHSLPDNALEIVGNRLSDPFDSRMQASVEAVGYIAHETDLTPVAMAIGPFSLMTKLLDDPITPVYMAGAGNTRDDDPDIAVMEEMLEIGVRVILRSVEAQIDAGATAVMIAEPAANRVYLSPKQLDKGSDIFEKYVTAYNRKIKDYCDERGADLLFHCCGEITPYMLGQFISLHPTLLSLGGSRILWEDAQITPKDIILYGNMPSKSFYSDDVITLAQVEEMACELLSRMKKANHPFILGSECDVLNVEESREKIVRKVNAFCNCECP